MTIDPPLPTIGLVLFASLIAMLVAGFVFAAAAKRGAAAVVALVLCTALGALMLTGVTYQRSLSTEAVAHARAEAEAKAASVRELARQIAMQEEQAASTRQSNREQLPWEIKAEVASDEELAAVASAQPKIKLEEVATDSKPVYNNLKNTSEPHPSRPEWIDAHLGDNQKLIVSGPFTAKETCRSDTQKQLIDWLWTHHAKPWPSAAGEFPGVTTDVSQVIKLQHEELRDTSVGEMHILYTLAEVTPEVEAQIAQSLADAAAQVARKRGVRAVTFTGAGVLSLVALTHVVLRSGGRKPKTSAN